ncbi:hypothetical protein D3C74_49790 [compost metagenome]
MGWREKMGLTPDEAYVFSRDVDGHFKDLGFYLSTMRPRFSDGYSELASYNLPVLRKDHGNEDGSTIRVFMNRKEIYVEHQTSWRSFGGSQHRVFEEPLTTAEEIEQNLDEMAD